jgi:hypothetical protein
MSDTLTTKTRDGDAGGTLGTCLVAMLAYQPPMCALALRI